MALHPDFPNSPHAILAPDVRWIPDNPYNDKLDMPPLVPKLREAVQKFRESGYVGASQTSKSLLNWWFNERHMLDTGGKALGEFQYYFAQREALETIIYLYDVVGAKDKFDLMRFDASGIISANMFDESWRRYVVKMAGNRKRQDKGHGSGSCLELFPQAL